MECPKCRGLMELDRFSDFFLAFFAWKCLSCGVKTVSHRNSPFADGTRRAVSLSGLSDRLRWRICRWELFAICVRDECAYRDVCRTRLRTVVELLIVGAKAVDDDRLDPERAT